MTDKLVHPVGIGFDFSPHVVNVCRPGAGAETCRYLVGGILGGDGGLHCAKFEPALANAINARIAAGTFGSLGDNCSGRFPEEVL